MHDHTTGMDDLPKTEHIGVVEQLHDLDLAQCSEGELLA